jgi:NADPH:quinone reductase-like Zn-dependent oxidoreductase
VSQAARLSGADGVVQAVVITRFGGPEVPQIVERPVPEPGLGEVRIPRR